MLSVAFAHDAVALKIPARSIEILAFAIAKPPNYTEKEPDCNRVWFPRPWAPNHGLQTCEGPLEGASAETWLPTGQVSCTSSGTRRSSRLALPLLEESLPASSMRLSDCSSHCATHSSAFGRASAAQDEPHGADDQPPERPATRDPLAALHPPPPSPAAACGCPISR